MMRMMRMVMTIKIMFRIKVMTMMKTLTIIASVLASCTWQPEIEMFIQNLSLPYRSNHWLALSLTLSLSHWLLFSRLDWCDSGVWRCQLKTCWGLLLMLMLMMRIVLATVWCILGSWSLVIKPNFCSDFEHKVCSRFWCWSSGKIFKLEFGQYFAADVLQRLWSWILIKICVWTCDRTQ